MRLTLIRTPVRTPPNRSSVDQDSLSPWCSALAYHNAQLEAVAFRDEFDPESFDDRTLPKYEVIHKVGNDSISQSWPP